MTLSPKQFNSKVYYHGTTEEAANSIAKNGFNLDQSVNGRTGGEGVYLTTDPSIAREFGPAVVEVSLRKGVKVHPRADEYAWGFNDPSVKSAHRRRTDPNQTIEETQRKLLSEEGYGAHKDYDKSIIVWNPKDVGYRGHTVPGQLDWETISRQVEKRLEM